MSNQNLPPSILGGLGQPQSQPSTQPPALNSPPEPDLSSIITETIQEATSTNIQLRTILEILVGPEPQTSGDLAECDSVSIRGRLIYLRQLQIDNATAAIKIKRILQDGV